MGYSLSGNSRYEGMVQSHVRCLNIASALQEIRNNRANGNPITTVRFLLITVAYHIFA